MRRRETKPQGRRAAERIAAELRGEAPPSKRRAAAEAPEDLGPFGAFVGAGACSERELRDTLARLRRRGVRLSHAWAALADPLALPLPRHRGRALPKLGRSPAAAARIVEQRAPSASADLWGSPIEQLREAAEAWPPDVLTVERGRLVRVVRSSEAAKRWAAALARARAGLAVLEAGDAAGYLAAQPGGERIGEALRLIRAALDVEARADDVRTRGRRQPDAFAEAGPSAHALAALHVGVKVRAKLLRWAALAVERSKP